MTPDFALNLSLDGISLLHRRAEAWVLLGEVSLDDPDLMGGLADLRQKAIDLAGEDFTTKVVVPNSQVLYAVLKADASDDGVRAALNGRTYHPLDDLVIDWQPATAGRVRVAAVTRETLAEAAQFAADSGFNPVAQVASPEDEQYDGEAWFGAVASAAPLVARHGAPARGPKAVVALEPIAAAEADLAPIPDFVSAGRLSLQSLAESAPDVEADVRSEPDAETVEEPDLSGTDDVQSEPMPLPDDIAAELPAVDLPPAEAETVEFTHHDSADAAVSPRLGGAQRARQGTHESARLGGANREVALETEPVRADAETHAATEVFDAAEDVASADMLSGNSSDGTAEDAAPEDFDVQETNHMDSLPVSEPEPSDPDGVDPADEDVDASADVPRKGWRFGLKRGAKASAPPPDVSNPFGSSAPPLAAREIAEPPAPKVFVPPPPKVTPAAGTGVEMPAALAKRLGVTLSPQGRSVPGGPPSPANGFNPFGAKPRPVERRRSGVTLAILLGASAAALGAFFIWASFLPSAEGQLGRFDPTAEASNEPLGNGEVLDPSPVADAMTPEEIAALANPAEGEVEAEALADGQDEMVATVAPEPDPAELTPTAEPESAETATAALDPGTVDPQEPATNEAPIGERADGIKLAAIDPVIAPQDAVALSPLEADTRVALQAPPLPFGTVLQLDARGLVTATPEGTMSPEGVMVFSGPVDVKPQPRPQSVIDAGIAASVAQSLSAPPEPTATDSAVTEATEGQPATEQPLPVSQEPNPLFEFKPVLRPGNLQETNERSVLGGLTRTELASFAPVVRPAEVPEVAPEPVLGLLAGNEFAPAVSPLPQKKPAHIAQLVAAAAPTINADSAVVAALGTIAYEPDTKAAAKPSKPDPAPATGQTYDTEGDEAAADIAPSIPTSASVAKQATVKNAIDLGSVALIGVYGSQSQRRALVRLPSGKYSRVKIGDKLDGGKVVAISDTQLQYQKRSKTITLAMPKV